MLILSRLKPKMNLHEAIRKANVILNEERAAPTISYEIVGKVSNAVAILSVAFDDRGEHPRRLKENPNLFHLRSTNFDLLCTLLDLVDESSKPSLLSVPLTRISDLMAFRHNAGPILGMGMWSRCSSELPLVAEFLARRGDKQLFINTLAKAAPSPGLSLLLVQLEEMIALNFTIFTEQEYAEIPTAIAGIERTIAKLREQPRPSSAEKSNTIYNVLKEVPTLCASVVEECRKARYLYVKGSLLPEMNVEINHDKGRVRTYLEKLGFSPLLIQSLEEAEKLYRADSTPFDIKSSIGHLRSFLEQLHLQGCALAHKKFGGSLATKWGEALLDLRSRGVLTVKEEQFVAQFYALMSDAAVHPLVAEHEYARLMRNMSIEYGLLLLTKMDKLGLN